MAPCPVCQQEGGFHDEALHGAVEVPVQLLLDGDRLYAHQIDQLRALRGAQLEREIMSREWFAHENDLVGGWCVMPVNRPPSVCPIVVGDFMSKVAATHVVQLHNRVLRMHKDD